MMTRMISVIKMRQRYIGIASTILASTLTLTLLINTVGIGIIDSSRDLTYIEGVHGVRRIRSFDEAYQFEEKNVEVKMKHKDPRTHEESEEKNIEMNMKHKVPTTYDEHPVRYSGAVRSIGANDKHITQHFSGAAHNVLKEDVSDESHLSKGAEKLILKASGIKDFTQDFKSLHDKLDYRYQYFHHPREVPLDKFSMNVTKSMMVSPNRILKDTRPAECKEQILNRALLPNVSIIIPFHNEHYSVLIRTVHSILNTVSLELLHEILLIDDFSDHSDLSEPLEKYCSAIPKLNLYRTKRHEGLIRARMHGARVASGKVLVFLDAHVEMLHGWLEPLILEIYANPKTVTIPKIGILKPDTLEPNEFLHKSYGSFSWELDFVWQDIPKHLLSQPATVPIFTATMIGCAFAVGRDYFFELGGYDEGLDVWGGENLEISFRTWMCGGVMKLVQCSTVFHVFRPILPYEIPKGILHKNLQRVAEVWMDEYKDYFFSTTGLISEFTYSEEHTLEERKELRLDLQCHNFTWYLKNVSPELLKPTGDEILWGQMKNLRVNGCLNVTVDGHVNIDYCPLYLASQTFSYFENSQIIHQVSGQCLTFEEPKTVSLQPCRDEDKTQKWYYTPLVPDELGDLIKGVDTRKPVGSFWVRHGQTRLCLEQMKTDPSHYFPSVSDCQFQNLDQYWVFLHKITKH